MEEGCNLIVFEGPFDRYTLAIRIVYATEATKDAPEPRKRISDSFYSTTCETGDVGRYAGIDRIRSTATESWTTA